MDEIGSRATALIWQMVGFTIVCLIVLSLRLWAALLMRRSIYMDDIFILISFASIISFEGVMIWGATNGAGKRQDTLTPDQLAVLAMILVLPASITWLIGTVSIKFSLLFLYTRIFSVRSFRIWSYVLMGAVASYGIAFMALFMTICQPIDQLWNPVPGGHCRPTSIQEYSSVAFNVFIDICILILPLPWLWRLQMPLRNKIATSVMFSIGLSTVAVMLWRFDVTTRSAADPDIAYWQTDIALIALLEMWLGLIAASIPTLAPLLKRYLIPAVTKLMSISISSSARHTQEQISLGNISSSKNSRRYQTIDDGADETGRPFPVEAESSRDIGVVTNITHTPGTNQEHGMPRNKIYVQQDIEHQ